MSSNKWSTPLFHYISIALDLDTIKTNCIKLKTVAPEIYSMLIFQKSA